MPIIGTLPVNLQNGTTADASQVMSDFNFIVNQVNANGVQIGTLAAPTGTRVAFNQATAPVGWTTDTSAALTDCSFRVNQATGGATGGSGGWSTFNQGNTLNVNAFTLSIAQLPAHNHTDLGHTHTDSGHAHGGIGGASFYTNAVGGGNLVGGGVNTFTVVSATAASIANIQTASANIQNTGSGASIQPNYTTPTLKYTDFLIATKS
jgi:hypothetical protein